MQNKPRIQHKTCMIQTMGSTTMQRSGASGRNVTTSESALSQRFGSYSAHKQSETSMRRKRREPVQQRCLGRTPWTVGMGPDTESVVHPHHSTYDNPNGTHELLYRHDLDAVQVPARLCLQGCAGQLLLRRCFADWRHRYRAVHWLVARRNLNHGVNNELN